MPPVNPATDITAMIAEMREEIRSLQVRTSTQEERIQTLEKLARVTVNLSP